MVPTKLRGFTLIELLVVIAIIGILSSVVLASLNTARAKGSDSAVKSNLANARSQAELFYDANTNSYLNVCGTTAVGGVKPINAHVLAAAQAAGLTSVQVNTAAGGPNLATCNATAAGWVAEVPLKAPAGFFCVDYRGTAATSSVTKIGSSADIDCL